MRTTNKTLGQLQDELRRMKQSRADAGDLHLLLIMAVIAWGLMEVKRAAPSQQEWVEIKKIADEAAAILKKTIAACEQQTDERRKKLEAERQAITERQQREKQMLDHWLASHQRAQEERQRKRASWLVTFCFAKELAIVIALSSLIGCAVVIALCAIVTWLE